MLASGLMSKRRTREQKELSAKKAVLQVQESVGDKKKTRDGLGSDLTRTVIVAILAVSLQLVVAYYLNHGGWKFILERR